jgi:hypothetical protein
MTHRLLLTTGLALAVTHMPSFVDAQERTLPMRNGRPVVAVVNADAISLDEFVLQGNGTARRARLKQGLATAKDLELLDRLVKIKLVVQEAETMGLDELPEIRKQVDVTSREILREVLMSRLVKGVTADPVLVEKLFRDSVRQWKTSSLFFKDKAAAERARTEIEAGAPFRDVAAKAVSSRAAEAERDDVYHPRTDYFPQIGEAISGLRAGQVSPVVPVSGGFVLVRVVDIRYPENRAARADATKRALSQRQEAALKAHEQAARRQYVVLNKSVWKTLDYEAAKPGLDALLKDKRVIAEIKGAAPLTVGDLTDYLRMQFFHGSDQVKQRREMNEKKEAALEATLGRRLLNAEAFRLGIDKTNEYRDRVNGFRESLVFDAFIQKVIVPDNKMREDEVKQYYGAHLKEYSYPEMLKVRSLAFSGRPAAETAMRKLREGTDYGWLAANAEGQVAKGSPGVLTFDGRPVTTDSMPDGLRKVLAGSRAGDHRLYGGPQGPFYVLAVQQVIAANPKPYDEVRAEIAQKMYGEKLKKSVEGYAAKLRAQSKVAVYLTRMK